MAAGLFFCPESQKIRDQDSLEQQEVVSGKYVYTGKKRCAKYQKYHRSVSNVAMVCVAAVALGSNTYAWFVSNNEVSAKTTQIKAQSNTAFMSIEYKKTAVGTTTTNGAKKGDYIPVGDAVKAVTAHYAIGEASNYNISSAGVDLTNLVMNIIILQDR